ncbi:MAG: ABC-2 transporter permease [Clostridia bacterium]|nr:ABC-2 transporter permease [Clostridia bacterium]MDD4048725.1 ABC-2 transporter permease [Clostridia bacterium]
MYSLILKDILIQKKMIWFVIGYSVFILIAFNSPDSADAAYIMGAMMSSYLFIMGACAYEGKGNGEMILNSFPLRRKDVVRSRYISIFVFMFFSLAVMGALGAIMKSIGLPYPQNYITMSDVMGVVASLLIVSSIYLPFYYKFGYIRARVFNMIMFLIFFFVPTYLVNYIKENSEKEIIIQLTDILQTISLWQIAVIVMFIMLVIMFISYLISLSVYKKRDF